MKKKFRFSDLIKNSLIIGWLITLADFLYERIPKSRIVRFFSDYDSLAQKFRSGLIGGFLSHFKLGRAKTVELKRAFSSRIENSLICKTCLLVKEKLLTAKLRTYGAFMFAYGLMSIALCMVKLLVFHRQLDSLSVGISAALFIAGFALIFSKKPIGQALYDSLLIGYILSSFVGIRRDEMVFDTANDRGITFSFMLGMLMGISSYYISPLIVLGAVLAVILLLIMASKPEFGIIFIAFTLPFLPTMVMCGLSLFCTMAFVLKVARGKRTFRFEAVDFAVVIFMIFIFFGGTVSADVSSSLKSAAVFLALMLNYFLVANLIRNHVLTKRIMQSFVFSMFITALIGLYQKFFMAANTTWHDTTMFEDIGTRIYSTFQNPNVYGEYLVMAIPLGVAMLFVRKTYRERFAGFIMTAAALLALVYTQSRGAWLAFIISMAIYLLVKTGKMLVVYLLGIFSIPVLPFILPDSIVSRFMSIGNLNDSSTSYRVSIWRAAVNMIEDLAPGGIGIGTSAFSKVYPSYSLAGIEAAPHSHHLFFQITIEMGIFALISFIAIIFILVRKNSSGLITYGKESGYTLISSAALCGIVGMLVQGMTDYVWYNYRVFGMFFIIMGLCVSALRCAQYDSAQEYNKERNIM